MSKYNIHRAYAVSGLHACPTCKEKAKLSVVACRVGYYARCDACGEATFCYDSEFEAIEAWNRRAEK